MAYQLKSFADIYKTVMEELKVSSTDTTTINRIKRDVNIVYSEVVSEHRWWWLQENTTAAVQAYVNAGTASVVQGSQVVTLTVSPAASKTGYLFSIDGYSEIYRIESHTAGSLTFNLADAFTGATNPLATYKIYTDRVPLPVNCKETVTVWHDHTRSPLENVGIQQYRSLAASLAKAEGKPEYYCTSDFTDPVQATSIANLPGVVTRASNGMIKTLVFSAALPPSVTQGMRLRISQAGDSGYNGDIYVSQITTTVTSNDTITYTGREELLEAATADPALTVKALGTANSVDRYRQLFIYPCLTNQRILLHIDYVKECLALDADTDEPLIPVEERVVLVYGALHRGWSRERNPEEATRNYTLYQARLARMVGKLQDTFDKPKLKPSSLYLGNKRQGNLRGASTGGFYNSFGSGGGGGGGVSTGTPNTLATFNAQGVLIGLAGTNQASLQYIANLTSDAQAQLNFKQPTGNYITALTGDVSASGPASAASTVNSVGGSTAANIHAAEQAANAATNLNTASTLVKRDSSGNFSAGTITANLTGNASGTASSFTGNLTGPVTSTGMATAIGAAAVTDAMLATGITGSKISGNISGNAANITGVAGIASGGTGQVTAAAALNALMPSQTGNGGKFATTDGTNVSWGSPTVPSLSVPTKTASYTLTSADDVILGDATSGAITLTLPLASSVSGKVFRLKKIDSSTNAITIARTSTDTFDGVTSKSLTAQYQEMAFVSNGTNWYRIELTAPRSEVSVGTGNGFGSTNTAIRRFTNPLTNTGTAITYADSATLSGSFTINEDGLYDISYSETGGTADYAGISKNATSLTTSIAATTPANGKIAISAFAAGLVANAHRLLRLSAGDVIRAHCSGTSGNYNNTSDNTMFSIVKVGN